MDGNDRDRNSLERASEFNRKMIESAFDIVQQYTVPIYGFQDGTIRQDRTGVLLQIGTYRFMLTAAHKLQAIIENKIFLGVPRLEDGEPVRLEGCRALLSDEDLEDIAVFHLSAAVADEIARRNNFLRVHQFELNDPPEHPFYCVHGYPVAWKSFDVENQLHQYSPITFGTTPYDGDLETQDRKKHETFLRLIYGPTIDFIHSGEQPAPKAFGLSGCGIWQLCALRRNADLNWSIDEIKLAGIQHRQYVKSKKYVKGTRINVALRMICKQFPELKNAISLSI